MGQVGRKGDIMKNWLRCTIFPGQFTGEYAVRGNLFDGTGFSLFAEKQDLEFTQEPTLDNPIQGWIHIEVGPLKDDLLLVTLPQPSFENGQVITVKENQVRDYR